MMKEKLDVILRSIYDSKCKFIIYSLLIVKLIFLMIFC